jgi:hypothetical protein
MHFLRRVVNGAESDLFHRMTLVITDGDDWGAGGVEIGYVIIELIKYMITGEHYSPVQGIIALSFPVLPITPSDK